MAKCDICGKGAHFGNNVSHSHRRSNRIWNSNVKNVMCKVGGANKKLHVCTRCLRSGKVETNSFLCTAYGADEISLRLFEALIAHFQTLVLFVDALDDVLISRHVIRMEDLDQILVAFL